MKVETANGRKRWTPAMDKDLKENFPLDKPFPSRYSQRVRDYAEKVGRSPQAIRSRWDELTINEGFRTRGPARNHQNRHTWTEEDYDRLMALFPPENGSPCVEDPRVKNLTEEWGISREAVTTMWNDVARLRGLKIGCIRKPPETKETFDVFDRLKEIFRRMATEIRNLRTDNARLQKENESLKAEVESWHEFAEEVFQEYENL